MRMKATKKLKNGKWLRRREDCEGGGRRDRESRIVKIGITKRKNEEVRCRRKNWRRKEGREKNSEGVGKFETDEWKNEAQKKQGEGKGREKKRVEEVLELRNRRMEK